MLPRQSSHVSSLPQLCYTVTVQLTNSTKPKEVLACPSLMNPVVKCIRFAMLLALIGVWFTLNLSGMNPLRGRNVGLWCSGFNMYNQGQERFLCHLTCVWGKKNKSHNQSLFGTSASSLILKHHHLCLEAAASVKTPKVGVLWRSTSRSPK